MASKQKVSVTRTIGALHFEDLEPHRFEDLVRQLAYGYRNWQSLEATGRSGSDEGVDIRGLEAVSNNTLVAEDTDEDDPQPIQLREWRIQCKRYKTITPAQAKAFVRELVPDPKHPPYGIVLAVAAEASSKTIAAFHEERAKRGVTEAHLWTKAHLEDMLFRPENDNLLFAYFGISISQKKQNAVALLRSQLRIRKKLMQALKLEYVDDESSEAILVRDINNSSYPKLLPSRYGDSDNCHPVHTAEAFVLMPNGLWVKRFRHFGWLDSTGNWDIQPEVAFSAGDVAANVEFDHNEFESFQKRNDKAKAVRESLKDGVECSIHEYAFLPFTSIIEIDNIGDRFYQCPHIFCDFQRGSPYFGETMFRKVEFVGDHAMYTSLEKSQRKRLLT
jgi:hypothetical protein